MRARGPWIAWGFALQVIGVGIPVLTAVRRAHEAGLGGAVAVPLAAVAGLAVFGVVALVFAAIVAATASTGSADWGHTLSSFDLGDWPRRRRRK